MSRDKAKDIYRINFVKNENSHSKMPFTKDKRTGVFTLSANHEREVGTEKNKNQCHCET